VPGGWAGEIAVICVAEFTRKNGDATEPKLTEVAPKKLVPVMTTYVLPVEGPRLGLMPVTVGALATV
jgi:hypothetical protein